MLALISHPVCKKHKNNSYVPEISQRIEVISSAIKADYPSSAINKYEAPLASASDLLRVHDEEYIRFILSLEPKDTLICLDPETCLNQYTQEATLRAAGSAQLAVDLLMTGKANAAFCNIRPPGHHAERDRGMGFCFINNIAVGVAYALNHYQLNRVAIIDFDVHHGNGTEDIFKNEERVLLCSSFEHPFYPGTPFATDSDHILNLPLPAGTTSEQYREAVKNKWFEALVDFKPELIFFSAGFDGHIQDSISNLKLVNEDYYWLTNKIAEIAAKTCEGRMISLLEGGYNLSVLGDAALSHIKALTPIGK